MIKNKGQMADTHTKKIVVLGAGESGVGAARLAKNKGFEVFVSDIGTIQDKYETQLDQEEIHFEEGKHTEDFILDAHEIIKSPGIPNTVPILLKAQQNNIPIISEIEFGARYTQAKIVAITGSNGKTTTTLLTYHVLQAAGYNVGVGGNMGKSFCGQLADGVDHDYWVLEVSSFQLEHCFEFRPDVALILNITPDHLDRYENNFQIYINTKFRITQNLDKDQAFIYYKDNPAISRELRKRAIPTQYYPVSTQEVIDNGAYLKDDELHFYVKKNKRAFTLSQEDLNLKGKHNMINIMSSVLTCMNLDVPDDILKTYFKTFKGVEHRLEEVADIAGIRFINDSKATNVDSVYYALDSFDEKIIWIAGGVDKGNDYEKIRDLVKQKVKFLICLGKDNTKIFNTFRDSVQIIYQTDNMRDAVEQSFELARSGDIVLLSPACASFDLFENFEDRGKAFKKSVAKLTKLANLKKR
ncbi:MAG: UDP-N-acetylmuramoyl-L-alanine--D-glutamate ligase [Microscillaceae bacterium]|nr:UDP-N-acetylmuramoyl-L-alanine--D-glutamate ligase [Microscillaceae bacterium]